MEQNTIETGEMLGRERRRLRREAERQGGAPAAGGGGAWKVWLGLLIFLALIVGGIIALVTAGNKPPAEIALAVPVSSSDWSTGNSAKVANPPVLVEYSDYQCPACQFYYPLVKQLVADIPELVFVYRNFPLTQVHQNAQLGAEAAEAAGAQGQYWPMHDLLFEKHDVWSAKTPVEARPMIIGYAESLGLDVAKFTADLDSAAVKAKIAADVEGGLQAGVNATPSFFLNGKFITNPSTYANFVQLIKSSLASSTAPRS